MRKLLLLAATPFILAGCADPSPEQYGISPNVWNQLSPQHQAKITNNYYQTQSELRSFRSGDVDSANPVLKVTIRGGEILMPPFVAPSHYEPVSFWVQEGSCSDVMVYDTDKIKAVDLISCYKNGVLYLDPSRYNLDKPLGSVRLTYSPIWQRGFSYHNISSSGYARLHDVNIHIKQVDVHDAF